MKKIHYFTNCYEQLSLYSIEPLWGSSECDYTDSSEAFDDYLDCVNFVLNKQYPGACVSFLGDPHSDNISIYVDEDIEIEDAEFYDAFSNVLDGIIDSTLDSNDVIFDDNFDKYKWFDDTDETIEIYIDMNKVLNYAYGIYCNGNLDIPPIY